MIYFNDHAPAHVHAFGGGAWVVILIDGAGPTVREVHQLKRNDVARAVEIAVTNLELLKTAWRNIYGSDPD